MGVKSYCYKFSQEERNDGTRHVGGPKIPKNP